jgi:hypothetical protein
VLSAGPAFARILAGIAAGFQFNPVFAAVSAAVAAALAGYRKAPRSRPWWAAAVVAAGWAAGDGIRVAGSSAAAPYLAAWALTGLLVGYAFPAFAGAYVGRQVHKGTGYLAAAAVALMLVPALSVVAEPVANALTRLAA